MIEEKINVENACKIMFGEKFNYCKDTINYIQLSGLKKAYREKVKIYHPDRAFFNKIKENHKDNFNRLKNAYDFLTDFITSREKKNNRTNINNNFNNIKKKSNETSKDHDFYYSGKIPKRKLKFSEFLFYCKVISWQTLIKSITWQYKKRPKIGQLCLNNNILKSDEIYSILKNKQIDEKFGRAAVRQGYLTPEQFEYILSTQMKLSLPIGKFFTENQILNTEKLLNYLTKQKNHNSSY